MDQKVAWRPVNISAKVKKMKLFILYNLCYILLQDEDFILKAEKSADQEIAGVPADDIPAKVKNIMIYFLQLNISHNRVHKIS